LSGVHDQTRLSLEHIQSQLQLKELRLHVKNTTRSAEEIISTIEDLMIEMKDAQDSMGCKLFTPQMQVIWKQQREHVKCILDVPGVVLHSLQRTSLKGGINLPVYRCARGSSSQEMMHLYQNDFVPAYSASATALECYHLEGMQRWNEQRGIDFDSLPADPDSYCMDIELTHRLYAATGKVNPFAYRKYNGELFSVSYLLDQSTVKEATIYTEPTEDANYDEFNVDEQDPEYGNAQSQLEGEIEDTPMSGVIQTTLPFSLS
jgi:hypothetical protein